jgi:lipopolysaccharide transport system ATP-binding protein
MMPIVQIRRLGKRYRIGERVRSGNLRESIMKSLTGSLSALHSIGRTGNCRANDESHIWALKDVDLDVMPGEVLGIIGRNGAGKSTLLKILSRITEPTEGRVDLYGHVGSLLEVGTGFHPELTGRENVFLNGVILGMRSSEIAARFDQIVSFAEVEKFIDTPVKHYSSGMYVRLAFSVAAHMQPQVLVVDEVLAVGDAAFWQKSTDKMRELNARGMTILLVTHNMWLVQTVCQKALLLRGGRVAAIGSTRNIIEAYRETNLEYDRNGANSHELTEASISELQLVPMGVWASKGEALPDSGLRLLFIGEIPRRERVKFLVRLTSSDGLPFFTVYSPVIDVPPHGRVTCDARINRLMLQEGSYIVWVAICSPRSHEEVLAVESATLSVKDDDVHNRSRGIFKNQADWSFHNS